MGVGFQVPIKNLVSILISTAVKTARVVSLSGLKTLSFPLTGYSYEDEVSDLGNDIMFLSSLRKKIDDSLNDSVSPQVNTSIFTPLSIGRKYSKEEILKADSKQL